MTDSSQFAPGPSDQPGGRPVKGAAGEFSERRSRRRAMISAPVRVRKADADSSDSPEVLTTLDVSRNGILFLTAQPGYRKDLQLAVTFPYNKAFIETQDERMGRVMRVEAASDGRHAVAVAFDTPVFSTTPEASPDINSRRTASCTPAARHGRPHILIVDADSKISQSLKAFLTGQGYAVTAVRSADEGRDALRIFSPSLIVAEIEGGDLPGYTLCAHVKSLPALRHIPVVLTTRSAYPTDYSNGHSLGAVVCMAKPFQPERLGHIVRLLLPSHLPTSPKSGT